MNAGHIISFQHPHEKAVKDAKLEPFEFYCWRHTFGTRAAQSGMGDHGFMDLTFTGSLARLFSPLVRAVLEDDMTVHQTGKSAAIRIGVEGFRVSLPDEALMSKVRAAFAACVRLIRFYRQNREILDKAASESLPDLARRL